MKMSDAHRSHSFACSSLVVSLTLALWLVGSLHVCSARSRCKVNPITRAHEICRMSRGPLDTVLTPCATLIHRLGAPPTPLPVGTCRPARVKRLFAVCLTSSSFILT